jgi:CHASE3 domain sensor protein
MIQTIISIGKRIVQPVARLWRRMPLRVQGRILVILPLLAITISAVLALFGNHQRANIQADIQRHFQMVRGLNEVVTSMVNAETGMRGYLLTKRDEFLQPFATASQKLPSAMSDLRALAEAEPSYNPRLNKLRLLKQIQLLIDRQMADLTWQQQYVIAPNTFDTEVYNHLAYGKRTMDEIRANLNAMQSEEEQLLTERVQEINAIRQRDYLAIILALFIGLGTRLIARYLFSKENEIGSGLKE